MELSSKILNSSVKCDTWNEDLFVKLIPHSKQSYLWSLPLRDAAWPRCLHSSGPSHPGEVLQLAWVPYLQQAHELPGLVAKPYMPHILAQATET